MPGPWKVNMFDFLNKINLCLKIFFKIIAENWPKVALNCICLKQSFEWFELDRKWHLTWLKEERGLKHQQILSFTIVKWSFAPSLALKNPNIQEEIFSNNHLQKILEKIRKLRKAVTTSKTLTKYTMRSCNTILSNSLRL